MARRILSQTAIRDSVAVFRDHPPPSHLLSPRFRPPPSRFLALRWRSGRSEKHAQIFEVVIEPASEGGGDAGVSPSESTAAPGEAAARRLEDVIHGILARRAAPDWLPFIPGSSYWVPPRARSYRLVEVLGRAASPMTEEEVMSLTTVQGWPCAAHLLGGDKVEHESEAVVARDGEPGQRQLDSEEMDSLCLCHRCWPLLLLDPGHVGSGQLHNCGAGGWWLEREAICILQLWSTCL